MRPLRILQVAPSDLGGGAERAALSLHRSYRALGHEAWLAVGSVRGNHAGVVEIYTRVEAEVDDGAELTPQMRADLRIAANYATE